MAVLKDLVVLGSSNFISPAYFSEAWGKKFATIGGTASQFLKGDGSLDSTEYGLATTFNAYLPLAGGTMTGVIGLSTNSSTLGDLNKGLNFGTTGHIGGGSVGIGLYTTGSIYIRPGLSSLSNISTTNGLVMSSSSITFNGNDVWHTGNVMEHQFTNSAYGVLLSYAPPTKTSSQLGLKGEGPVKYYGVTATKNGYAYVGVPWTDYRMMQWRYGGTALSHSSNLIRPILAAYSDARNFGGQYAYDMAMLGTSYSIDFTTGTLLVPSVQLSSRLPMSYVSGSAIYDFRLPMQSGTIALTSDIPTLLWERSLGMRSLVAVGRSGEANGEGATAEGTRSLANGSFSHAEGFAAYAFGTASHAEGISGSVSARVQLQGRAGDTRYAVLDGIESLYEGMCIRYSSGLFEPVDAVVLIVDKDNRTVTLSRSLGELTGREELFELFGAIGERSHAEGFNTIAGDNAHAEGKATRSMGESSHAEGDGTTAVGPGSHAEGYVTEASGDRSHSEGTNTIASGNCSHAEGDTTRASSESSHAENFHTSATGKWSHAEGFYTRATQSYEHAQGAYNVSAARYVHSVGIGTSNSDRKNAVTIMNDGLVYITGIGEYGGKNMTGAYSLQDHLHDVELTTAAALVDLDYRLSNLHVDMPWAYGTGECSAILAGSTSEASGDFSVAEGDGGTASGDYSHAEGGDTNAESPYSHAEGFGTTASGLAAHAEGQNTTASQSGAHTEGQNTTASGPGAHAEGFYSTASGGHSHAEGGDTTASGQRSHAEGYLTTASNLGSHSEGQNTTASSGAAHAEGKGSVADGPSSHAEGFYTITSNENKGEHAEGSYNKSNIGTMHSIGIGYFSTSANLAYRANAFEVMSNGDIYAYHIGNFTGTNIESSTTYTLQQCVDIWEPGEGEHSAQLKYGGASAIGAYSVAIGSDGPVGVSCDIYSTISSGSTTIRLKKEIRPIPEIGDKIRLPADGTEASIINIDYSISNYYNITLSNTLRSNGTISTTVKLTLIKTVNLGSIGQYSFKNGASNKAFGSYSHAEGTLSTSFGSYSHAEGYSTYAAGNYSHAEGSLTTTYRNAWGSHAEGYKTASHYPYSHAEGIETNAVEYYAHSEGSSTKASGSASHAEGAGTIASGSASHAEGQSTKAYGSFSHAEGFSTKASNDYSHAEGSGTTASGVYSHAEGENTRAYARLSHAEGSRTITYSNYSHAEGNRTITFAYKYYSSNGFSENVTYSHAEGSGNWGSLNADVFIKYKYIPNNTSSYNIAGNEYEMSWKTGSGWANVNTGEIWNGQGTKPSGTGWQNVTYGNYPLDTVRYANGMWYNFDTQVLSDSANVGKATKYAIDSGKVQIGDLITPRDHATFIDFILYPSNIFSRILAYDDSLSDPDYYKIYFTPNKFVLNVDYEYPENPKSFGNTYFSTTLNSARDSYIFILDPGKTSLPSYTAYYAPIATYTGFTFGYYSHSEGNMTSAIGDFSHTEGSYTKAFNEAEHAQGAYNKSHWANAPFGSNVQTLFSVGCGTALDDRKNAIEIMQNGDVYVKGIGGFNGDSLDDVRTLQTVINNIDTGGGGNGNGNCDCGNSKVFYGTCPTPAGTAVKAVTCSDFTSSDLVEGVMVIVKFANTNSAAVDNLKLNVNYTGEIAIKKMYNSAISDLTSASELQANSVIPFVYTGSRWLVVGLDYRWGEMTQAQIAAGSSNTSMAITPKLLRDNFTYAKVTSSGQIKTIEVCTTPGTDSSTLYVVL